MSNERFLVMKAHSDDYMQKRREVQWLISTLEGMVLKACKTALGRHALGSAAVIVGELPNKEKIKAYLEISQKLEPPEKPKVLFTLINHDRGPELTWTPEEVTTVHNNLDQLIWLSEAFCDSRGLRPEFDQLMSWFK